MHNQASRKLMLRAALLCQLWADFYLRPDSLPWPVGADEECWKLANDSFFHAMSYNRPLAHDYAEAAAMLYNDELPPGWEHA